MVKKFGGCNEKPIKGTSLSSRRESLIAGINRLYLMAAKEARLKYRKKIKLLRQQCRITTEKKIQTVISHLQGKKLISEVAANTLLGVNHIIKVKVLGQDNVMVQFIMKRQTPLRKLMNAYCDRYGLAMQTTHFQFDGQPINESDTAGSLEMEEGDKIEVYTPQDGGAPS